MNKLKYLIEQATRKTEMRWRVFAYDPDKDNALVGTPKTYDCICGASAAKMEILKDHPNYVVEIIAESVQKNEAKSLDDISTKEIANYIKTLKFSMPLNHPMSMNILGTKLKEKFGLSEKPHSIAIKALLDNMPKEYLEAANIDVKNPGVLEVPDGKKVDELPQSHFEKLVDKKGYAEVIRALTNLEVWNKDKNKSLSSWASNMADKLKKKYRPESRSIDKDSVIAKNGKYYHKVHGYEVELRDGKFHRANTVDNANTRTLNKKIDDLSKSKTINDNSLADEKELRNLVDLKVKLNTLKDAYEKETDTMSKSKLRVAIKQLEDNIATQEEVVSSSHNVNKDKLTTKQIPNLLNTKK